MKKEIKEKLTNFVKWCIDLNKKYQEDPSKYEELSVRLEYIEVDKSRKDTKLRKLQRKKIDLFNSEQISGIIKGNVKKKCGNIFTYTLRKGIQEQFNMEDLQESFEIQSFTMNYLPKRKEFLEILDLLNLEFFNKTSKENYSGNKDLLKRNLEYFIHEVLIKDGREELSDELLDEYIIDFLNQISGNPPETIVINYIHGIYLCTKQIELLSNTILKFYKDSDFEEIGRYGALPYDYSLYEPNIIMKCRYTKNEKKLQNEFEEKIVKSLQLYRTGSILITHRLSFTKNMLDLHKLEFEEKSKRWVQNSADFFVYQIEIEEKDELLKFISEIMPKLSLSRKNNYGQILTLAIERYQRGLLDEIEIDRKVLSVIMGFEPLLKKKSEKKDIGTRIANRISYILKFFNFNEEEVKRNFKKAYNYRSMITHGVFLKDRDFKGMASLFPTLLNYLRLIIVVYLLEINNRNDFFINLKDSINNKSNILDKKLMSLHQKYTNCFDKKEPLRFKSKSLLDVKKIFEELESKRRKN